MPGKADGQARGRKRDQSRDLLVAAAYEAFLAKGYAGASITDILADTGLSRGAIYHHFDDKLALFDEVIARYLPFPFEDMDWAAYAEQSAADQKAAFAAMYEAMLASGGGQPTDRYYALYFDALSHLPKFRRMISAGYSGLLSALAAAELRSGAADAADAEARARRFVAGFEGEIYLRAVIRSDENE